MDAKTTILTAIAACSSAGVVALLIRGSGPEPVDNPDASSSLTIDTTTAAMVPGSAAALDPAKSAALLDAARQILAKSRDAGAKVGAVTYVRIFDCPSCPTGLGLEAVDAYGRASGPLPPDAIPDAGAVQVEGAAEEIP